MPSLLSSSTAVILASLSVGIFATSASAQVSVDLTYQGSLEIDAVRETTSVTLRLGVFGNGQSAVCLEDAVLDPSCGRFVQEITSVPVEEGAFSVGLSGVPVGALEGLTNLGVAVLTPSGEFVVLGLQPLRSHPSAAVAYDGPFAPPVGSIIAWHPAAVGMTAADLPANWALCNGQTVNGFTLPDLNGQARFLRGGNTSGNLQSDSMQNHTHIDSGHNHTIRRPRHFASETTNGNSMYTSTDSSAHNQPTTSSTDTANLGGPTTNGAGTPRVGAETRPTNMSVVWIMRVE